MILQRTDIYALVWRVLLLAGAVITLAYSSIRKIEFDPRTAMVTQSAPTPIGGGLDKLLAKKKDYQSIAEHPLFEPSRQPWFPPKTVVQNAALSSFVPPAPTGYVLVGIVLSADQHTALLRDNFGTTRSFSEGSKIDGWSVGYVDATGVYLYFSDHKLHITMHKQAR